jgi:cytochrome c5
MSDHQHESPIKNWKQLVVVVVAAFAIPIALIVLVSQFVSGGPKGAADDDHAVLNRIKPVGEIKLAVAGGPKGALTGDQVYEQVCKTCHENGLAGAHKIGDKAAWAKVIAQGPKLTYEHAIAGIRAMPAKGGNPNLEDIEVQRAVAFMVNKAGAGWMEPAGPAAIARPAPPLEGRTGEQVVAAACGKCHQTGQGGAPKIGDRAAWTSRLKLGLDPVVKSALKGHAGMPARGGLADLTDPEVKRAVEYMMNSGAATATVAAPVVAAAAAPAAAADGKKVYDTACMACHATGVAGAPKFGDKAAWAPRLKTGMDALYTAALKGKGAMPAKAGNAALSDAEVKAGVDYMTAAAK